VATAGPAAVRPAGSGHAVAARSVSVAAAAGSKIVSHVRLFGPLGRNGQAAGGTLPVRRSTGVKKAPVPPAPVPGGPNAGHAVKAPVSPARAHGAAPRTAPATINASFRGMGQGGSNCGNCQPPDPSAAVSPTQIAHTVNLRLQVYSKAGALLCGASLGALAGTSAVLSDPHIQYDNVYQRFSMVFIPVPATNNATPTEYLLTSKTSNACGPWWVYTVTFSGSLFPPGTLLDYPYLGQDNNPSGSYPSGGSILSSTNNFCCNSNNFHTYLN
jgi:hypothetical protein